MYLAPFSIERDPLRSQPIQACIRAWRGLNWFDRPLVPLHMCRPPFAESGNALNSASYRTLACTRTADGFLRVHGSTASAKEYRVSHVDPLCLSLPLCQDLACHSKIVKFGVLQKIKMSILGGNIGQASEDRRWQAPTKKSGHGTGECQGRRGCRQWRNYDGNREYSKVKANVR